MEEIPSYSDATYADRFLKGYSVFPDDSRIFHRADCQYDFITALTDNFGMIGYLIVGIFILTWTVSVLFYRFKGYDRLDVTPA